ncbi:MAG: tRNA epoxyqueuosine(34) reductase QueG [Bacteroidales bacterium]|nr:tRNA epoxyqueuosine(34) reductase QueG [Bacteroidales bacterium]
MTLSSSLLKQLAVQAGLDLCGVVPATEVEGFGQCLQRWLEAGANGAMAYMERWSDKRADPRLLVEGARSVVSVAVAYKPTKTMGGVHKIAQYAYVDDYHNVLKTRLHTLVALIKERHPEFEAKVCVDTAPITDKLWAARAGLGWIGRNTLLVTPQYGSYVNLGELVTTALFDSYDTPVENRCGSCRRCVEACPGHALDDSATLGLIAPRCTSYLTVEPSASESTASRTETAFVFGCDVCQQVCPYCQSSPAVRTVPQERMAELEALPEADEETYRRITQNSPMSRLSYEHWRKNCGKTPRATD